MMRRSPRRELSLLAQSPILKAFRGLYGDLAGWQHDLAAAVDVGEALRAQHEVAADILVVARGSTGHTSQRGEILS